MVPEKHSETRTALITGGSRGIGLAVGRELAFAGHKVLLVARDEQKLKLECEKIQKEGGSADSIVIDFRSKDYLLEIRNYLEERNIKPTILINGLGGGFGSKTWDDISKYLEVFQLNFFVSCELTSLIRNYSEEQKWGRFIYIGTMAVNHMSASAPYVSAKAALMSYMKKVAKELVELNENLMACAVVPGAINVPGKYLHNLSLENKAALGNFLKENGIGIHRLGEPQEVARVVKFLCQEETNYLHGCAITVDGGASN
jgi:3-oxoacyl-[acyl-carrier protein] reductase